MTYCRDFDKRETQRKKRTKKNKKLEYKKI